VGDHHRAGGVLRVARGGGRDDQGPAPPPGLRTGHRPPAGLLHGVLAAGTPRELSARAPAAGPSTAASTAVGRSAAFGRSVAGPVGGAGTHGSWMTARATTTGSPQGPEPWSLPS